MGNPLGRLKPFLGAWPGRGTTLARMGNLQGTSSPMPTFSKVSLTRLSQAHPELQRLMKAAIVNAPVDFMITEVLRTPARQAQLKAKGASKTSNSRHLTGHAVDVACLIDGKVEWAWPLYEELAAHIKVTAKKLGIDITWGGDWKSLRDGPHYELTWARYPK